VAADSSLIAKVDNKYAMIIIIHVKMLIEPTHETNFVKPKIPNRVDVCHDLT
jgi:hypothetical protein